MTAPDPNPPRKRDIHPVLLIALIVFAVLMFPVLIYGLIVGAFALLPGSMD